MSQKDCRCTFSHNFANYSVKSQCVSVVISCSFGGFAVAKEQHNAVHYLRRAQNIFTFI